MSTGLITPRHSSSLWSTWLPCLAPTILLVLVSSIIVLSLIPLYIPTRTLTVEDSYSSLLDGKYSIPNGLVANLSANTMTLRLGQMSSNRVELLETILQSKLSSTRKFHTIRIDLQQAIVQSDNDSTVAQKQFVRARRLANEKNVILYQESENSKGVDQLQISFRLAHRGTLAKNLMSTALLDISRQIEFNVTTSLFGAATSLTNTTSRMIAYHVKDNELINLNGVRIFAVKDYTGNVQSVYAIETDNAIYTIQGRRIVRIQSPHAALTFNYDEIENQYRVLFVVQNASYEVPITYQKPNITFPMPVFDYPQNESVPNIFTGVLLELNNKVTSRSIEDATVVLNYIDANSGNKSVVMLNTGGGRYYVPLPTNDALFDKYFDPNKLFSTTALQSDACLQLFQAYPIADICSRIADAGKTFCSLIAQEMTVTIPDVLRTTSQNISGFQWQAQSFGQLSDLEVIAFIPGEKSVRIALNASNQIPTTIIPPSTRTIRSTTSATIDPNQLSTFTAQTGGARGQCNEQTVAGGDTPDDRIIDMGKSNITVKFSYETYFIKDQIDVYYMNRQIFSTGCVGANGNRVLTLDNSETTFRVNVIPNCAGETDTAWLYSFQCPDELICEDSVCYCGISRTRSTQVIPPAFNGCGGEDGGALNYLIQGGGILWGFVSDCNQHDQCYDTCNSIRPTCDTTFWTGMLTSCIKFLPIPQLYLHCTIWANTYFIAVRLEGAQFFHTGQQGKCKCLTSG